MLRKMLVGILLVGIASLWAINDPEFHGKKATRDVSRVKLGIPKVTKYHSSSSASTKAVVVNEGFESGLVPPDGWSQYRVGDPGGAGWQITGDYTYSGYYAVYHNDDHSSSGEPIEDWLVTPAVMIPNGAEGATLTFYTKTKYAPSWTTYRGVWISTGSPDPSDGDYVELADFSSVGWDSYTEITLDLSAYAGNTVYIAFKYMGDWSDEWYIDDVTIDNGTVPVFIDVLVVDDYTDYPNFFGMFFAYSLYRMGYTFDYFSTGDSMRAPTLDELSNYNAVIWTTGSTWSNDGTYFDDALDVIGQYLDNGGNVWVSSQDYLYWIGEPAAWMHIGDYVDDAYSNSFYTVNGISGSPIGDGFNFDIISSNYAYNYIDIIQPAPDANAEFSITGDPVAISYSGAKGGKLFFNAFVFANINSSEDRDTLAARVMNFFGISPRPEQYNVGIENVTVDDIFEGDEAWIYATAVNYGSLDLPIVPVEILVFDASEQVVYAETTDVAIDSMAAETLNYEIAGLSAGEYHGHVCTLLPADQDHSTDTANFEFKVFPILNAPFVDEMDNLDNWMVGGDGDWAVVQQSGYVELTRGSWDEGHTWIVARINTGDLVSPQVGFKWSTSSCEDGDYLYVLLSRDLEDFMIVDSITDDHPWEVNRIQLRDYGIAPGDTFYLMFLANLSSNYDYAYVDSVFVSEGFTPMDASVAGQPNPELWDSTIVDPNTGDTLPVLTDFLMTPSLRVVNRGQPSLDPSISFRAFYKIFDPNGVLVYSQARVYRNLPAGDTAEIFFPGFIPTRSGVYRLIVTLRCPGDPNIGNNTFSAQFYVPPHKGSAGEGSVPDKLMMNVKTLNRNSTIEFGVPMDTEVRIRVYDMTGRMVAELANGSFSAGYHRIQWDAPRSGVYVVRMESPVGSLSNRIVVVK